MTPSQLTAVWSVAPAKLLGISHITGDLSKGKRADITASSSPPSLLQREMGKAKGGGWGAR